MSKNPKFMVFHLKDFIITISIVLLIIIAISLLLLKFTGNTNSSSEDGDKYVAGTYSSSINLNNATAKLTVTVDKNHINNISLDNTSETVETMYPLITPAIEDIAFKVIDSQSTEHISCSKENLYTYTMLLGEIDKLLETASSK